MRASYVENGRHPSRPGDGKGREEGHEVGRITIEEAIRLTAHFEREWFRSPRTLDEDLARFATACRLSAEEVGQVRRVMEAMSDGEGAEELGSLGH